MCRGNGTNGLLGLLVLTLLTSALAGCDPQTSTTPLGAVSSQTTSPISSTGIDTWPVASPPPSDLSLTLSKSTVQPGDVITRTIRGAHDHIVIGNDSRSDGVGPEMMLEQSTPGGWRLFYYLWLSYQGQKPRYTLAVPNIAIPLIRLSPEPTTILIPDLPPGTYRLREDVEREDLLTPLPATPSPPIRTFTLYVMIHVVSPAATSTAP